MIKSALNIFAIVFLFGLVLYFYGENKRLTKDLENVSNHMVTEHAKEDSLKSIIDSLNKK